MWDRHTTRAGFRLARARVDDTLVGFGYGYRGEHGQWWTDHAARVLSPEVAERWLGGHFELVSIGVLSRYGQQGIGRALMHELTSGLDEDRWLLMTSADPADPARLLYAREDWQVIGPGLRADQVIMGRQRQPGP